MNMAMCFFYFYNVWFGILHGFSITFLSKINSSPLIYGCHSQCMQPEYPIKMQPHVIFFNLSIGGLPFQSNIRVGCMVVHLFGRVPLRMRGDVHKWQLCAVT